MISKLHQPAPIRKSWGKLLILLLAIVAEMGVVALFPILYFYPLPIPILLSPSNTQQVVNGLTSLMSVLFGFLFSCCLDANNQQGLQRSLALSSLSLLDIKTRTDTSSSSIWSLIKTSLRVSSGKARLARLYLVALCAFGGVHTILGVLLVISLAERPRNPVTLDVTLSTNVASASSQDPCTSIDSGDCVYDRVMSSLAPLLITLDPYTIDGFTFQFTSTFGIPSDIFRHFQGLGRQSIDGKYQVDYCVPLIAPITLSCKEDDSRAAYNLEDVINGFEVFTVTINPSSTAADSHVRVSFQNGTMTIAQSQVPGEENITVITASGIYVEILSTLMTGSTSSTGTYTVACTSTPRWEWQVVSLYLSSGTLFTLMPGYLCESGQPFDFVPVNPLPYFIQGTTRVVNAVDGYSKYLNIDNILPGDAAPTGNISQLDIVLSSMYSNVQTVYTETVANGTTTTPIPVIIYHQSYLIAVTWNIFTILAFLGSLAILFTTIALTVQFCLAWPTQYIELDLTKPIDAMRLANDSIEVEQILRNLPVGSLDKVLDSPASSWPFGL